MILRNTLNYNQASLEVSPWACVKKYSFKMVLMKIMNFYDLVFLLYTHASLIHNIVYISVVFSEHSKHNMYMPWTHCSYKTSKLYRKSNSQIPKVVSVKTRP